MFLAAYKIAGQTELENMYNIVRFNLDSCCLNNLGKYG